MSEQASGSPARPPLPQLCAWVTFSIRDGIRKNVFREQFLWCPGLLGSGQMVFILGGLLMAVCRKQAGRWCVGGDLSVSLLGCSLLP